MNNQVQSTISQTYVIAGLGNPGRQYRNNRHNIGFMLADQLAQRLGLSFSRVQFRALTADGRYQDNRLVILKPQTYMNESGISVAATVKFYKVPPENLLVAHDDIDLPLDMLRLRPGGGSAGQKGVQSIMDRLGTKNFPRLRIGVGRPPGRMLAAAYVLQDFSKEDQEFLDPVLGQAVDAVLTFVTHGLETAMNQYNGAVLDD